MGENNSYPMTKNPYLKQAIEYIESHNLATLSCGRHDIDGDNVFVYIVETELHPCEEAKYEVHNAYIDIHVPISGAESYGVMPRQRCKVAIGDFDEKDDFLCYADPVVQNETRQAGEYIIFGPDDAHAPLIGEGSLKKAIFKVRVV